MKVTVQSAVISGQGVLDKGEHDVQLCDARPGLFKKSSRDFSGSDFKPFGAHMSLEKLDGHIGGCARQHGVP